MKGSPQAPYFLSCIEIIEDPGCPENRTLTTVDFQIESQRKRYRASNKILSGATIDGGKIIYLTAGQEVELNIGFEVKQNSGLEISIEDCPNENE